MNRPFACASFLLLSALWSGPAAAQQRPLATQDPETIGAGRVLFEAGMDYARDTFYPLSGMEGNLLGIPVLGLNVGLGSIADLQLTGGLRDRLAVTKRSPAPLADQAAALAGETTHAVRDLEIGAKIRMVSEAARRPSFGFRFSTRLPNAKHDSGMGQDTTDFSASLLAAKTVSSVRVVGNIGFTIMSEPLTADKQNDVLTYGISFAHAMTEAAEIVGEINGRKSTRPDEAPIGTESRGTLKVGGRYTKGPVRFDAALFFGLHAIDPTLGFTGGLTYVFNAFKLP